MFTINVFGCGPCGQGRGIFESGGVGWGVSQAKRRRRRRIVKKSSACGGVQSPQIYLYINGIRTSQHIPHLFRTAPLLLPMIPPISMLGT